MEFVQPKNSTTVRIEESPVLETPPPPPKAQTPVDSWLKADWRLAAVRSGMKALSRLSPSLAARAVDRLWFSAPRTHPNAEARERLQAGTRLHHRVHGREVVAWSWGEGPTVLLVHGWGGHAGQLHAFVEPLLAAGYRVVAFDAPAHGASAPSRFGGKRVTFFEIAEAMRTVAADAGPLAGAIAHSGGCAVLALAMRQGWPAPAKLAFVSPFAQPSTAFAPFGRSIGASDEAMERFVRRVEARFQRPWSDFDITGLPGLRPVPPLLLVHDRGDREVAFAHSEAIARTWPDARLVPTDGLGHRKLLRERRVVEQVAGFFGPAQKAASPAAMPGDARNELDRYFEGVFRAETGAAS